jgi:hypothetical protein
MWNAYDMWSDDPEWDAEKYSASEEEELLCYIYGTGQVPQRSRWEEIENE